MNPTTGWSTARTGYSNVNQAWGDHRNERAWVDGYSNSDWDVQIKAIRDGGMFAFVQNERLYKCPTGRRRPGNHLLNHVLHERGLHTWVQGVKGGST